MLRTIQGYVCPVSGLRRFSVRKTGVFSCALPTKTIPSFPLKRVVLLGDVVLALPLGEGDQGDLFLLDEAIDRGDEGLAHGVHEGRGGEGLSAMEAEESGHAAVGLQPGLVDVEVHAVDAFDLEGHVLLEDIGDGTW